ncbi:helix-turn-helix transcriptional regulator [Hoeflea sp. WL0058]|uniref:Helix-turn-helix transcriptional regulator n=1 Tax=Flavimaribacter sediminis TaxID=2865987 RepID=A0AAE2ZHX3_9HYPH|nr:helix-turn-helix transcriptional regulator [Flavimaribacter sediminis]MBW8637039.1 helix-turn-helix transcriptional regulator [Flavimaribacter sediminis]
MNAIRKLREQRNLTQTELARRAQTSQPQINRLETGERQLSKEWAEKLAPHLGISPAELMFGLGSDDGSAEAFSDSEGNGSNAAIGSRLMNNTNDVPVYGQAVGGDDGEFVLNGEKLDDVFRPPSLSSVIDAYAVYVTGSSMEPRYFDGEVVYVNPIKKARRGDFVVAQIRDPERETTMAYVKRFVRWNERELVLFQYNPEKELKFQARDVISVHLAVMGGSV